MKNIVISIAANYDILTAICNKSANKDGKKMRNCIRDGFKVEIKVLYSNLRSHANSPCPVSSKTIIAVEICRYRSKINAKMRY